MLTYSYITVNKLFDPVCGNNYNLDAGEFMLKLNQLQRISHNSPHYLQLPHIIPKSISISILEENYVVLLSVDICNYFRRNYCKSCANLLV